MRSDRRQLDEIQVQRFDYGYREGDARKGESDGVLIVVAHLADGTQRVFTFEEGKPVLVVDRRLDSKQP